MKDLISLVITSCYNWWPSNTCRLFQLYGGLTSSHVSLIACILCMCVCVCVYVRMCARVCVCVCVCMCLMCV